MHGLVSDAVADVDDSASPSRRIRLDVRGAVQGVGFRPYVHRLAASLRLSGRVLNTPHGVVIEVEGSALAAAEFERRLPLEAPTLARIEHVSVESIEPTGAAGFEIVHSESGGAPTVLVQPDAATCADCLREIRNLRDRRFRYPFTNCTQCGPRFSIIESLPYDRPNTSMRGFRMCAACRAEYDDPDNRRFHAQPNACPVCGPQLSLWDSRGRVRAVRDDALRAAAEAIRGGQIVALKGIGGFQLLVDARSEDAVRRLRARKCREEKPLAVLVPSLASAIAVCRVNEEERRLLTSPAAPIVLLRRRRRDDHAGTGTAPQGPSCSADFIADAVAPGNPDLGVMLPYSPLHHLLMDDLAFPIVATSGNRSDEPICTDEGEALRRLAGIADLFLVHDRPIVRHVDDSVVRVVLNRETVMRRARGYAPLPIGIEADGPIVLGVGAHIKNAVGLAIGTHVFLSQHIGDLETPQACDAFERAAAALALLYHARPGVVACDLHPDYASSRHARRAAPAPVRVQHHHAHVAACMAEHGLTGEVLGVCWDGTGLGDDGTNWGGEFLRATSARYARAAHLRPFPLPGGDRAARAPRRSALGALFEAFGTAALGMDDLPPIRDLTATERAAFARMLERGVNAPRTSSMGRLFDAVASLLGLRQAATFEGQAAMELEFAAGEAFDSEPTSGRPTGSDPPGYPFSFPSDAGEIDWRPILRAIVADLREGIQPTEIAARFHRTLIEIIIAVAARHERLPVVLTGGCFQNALLLEGAARRLHVLGRTAHWPHLVPANDGGIALGQVVVARARLVRPMCRKSPNDSPVEGDAAERVSSYPLADAGGVPPAATEAR